MAGRICMVTGATSGIGEVTARALAERGATVIVAGRNPEKSAETVRRIRQQTGNPAVEYMLADLSSQEQVRHLASQFRNEHEQLHVLVNNAGGLFANRQQSVDGIEMTLAVNYLAPFLLTNLLLDPLKAAAPSRVVNVSSNAHLRAKLKLDDLQSERGYSGMGAYGMSKLALVMFTYEMARRLEGTGVTVNALHPGFVGTAFAKNNGQLYRLAMDIIGLFARSPEKGAQTSIYLATSPEVETVTGRYFADDRQIRSAPVSYDEALARRLWQVSEEMTGLAGAGPERRAGHAA